mmetsp:Transcript_18531/g.51739  ORF Transcript_18531/g.51739 Transcript_18531/m.51739 type:complete len:223 (+) Transcript_18531:108-776(+)
MALNEFSILDDDLSKTTPTAAGEATEKQTETTTTESEEEKIDVTKLVAEEEKHLVKPAGVGGAVVGFLIGGPVGSALLGFGAAYAVRKKNGPGDVARALGELTISVQDKATELEEKNKYMERSKQSIGTASERVPKTREFVVSNWKKFTTFTKEKQLVEKGVENTGKGFEFIGDFFSKLFSKKKSDDEKGKEDYTFVSTDEVKDETRGGDTVHSDLSRVTTH